MYILQSLGMYPSWDGIAGRYKYHAGRNINAGWPIRVLSKIPSRNNPITEFEIQLSIVGKNLRKNLDGTTKR